MTINPQFDAYGRETVPENRKSDGTGIDVYTAQCDNAGNCLNVVELDGGRVTAVLDARGAEIASMDQLGALTSWQFDGDGNPVIRLDARQAGRNHGTHLESLASSLGSLARLVSRRESLRTPPQCALR